MTNNHIIISALKGVKSLNFEMPLPGIHVITASNGSGKTTLMHCIERLSNTRVFNENFTQHSSWNVDSFEKSKITYKSSNQNEVTYTYRSNTDMWRPTTHTTSTLDEFGYSNIVAMPPLGQRVYIQIETIRGGTLTAAQNELRTAMASVLENNIFLKLRKFRIGETRGRGGAKRRKSFAFLLPKGTERRNGLKTTTYFSESSFSLGEIFTLNLLFEIENIPDNSLLLIDELEVALHPRVQVNLLRHLKKKAIEKNLTVIISTHSSSLIKCADSLIFLENTGGGEIRPHYNCYPSLALQKVAVEEDMTPDYVFFVEDSAAELYLKEKINQYFVTNAGKQRPLWKVLPIGGYSEVLRFMNRANQYIFSNSVGQYAFLDNDVIETRDNLRQKGNNRTEAENDLYDLFRRQKESIKYLSVTPELGLWQWLSSGSTNVGNLIDEHFPDATINISNLLHQCDNNFSTPANNPRKEAKNKMGWIFSKISELSNEDLKRVKRHLFAAFVFDKYSTSDNQSTLNQIFAPIFSNQGNS